MNAGDVFGRWTVIEMLGSRNGHTMASVRCECGMVVDRYVSHLESGASRGCRRCNWNSKQKSSTPEYDAWVSLIQRCTNPKNPRWKDYGGRGIRVCDAWRASFDAFLADVGPRPGPDRSIDRIDNDGHYEPGNIRWSTRSEQQFNRRTARRAQQQVASHA